MAQLPSLRSPSALQAAPRRPKGASVGKLTDSFIDAIDNIEETSGEFAAEMVRAFAESHFRSMGIPIDIKSKSERELIRRQTALAEASLREKESAHNVRTLVGFLLDNKNTPVGQLFPSQAGNDTTLEDAFQINIDASLLDRPEDLVTVSRALSVASEGAIQPVARSDLLLSDLTKEAARKTVQARGAEKVAKGVKAQSDISKDVIFQGQIAEGDTDNPITAILARELDAFSRAKGGADIELSSIGDSFVFGGDDADEAEGSAGISAAILRTAAQAEKKGIDRETVFRGILQGPVGERIGEVLAGGDVVQGGDGRRLLKIHDSATFNSPQAVGNFMVLIDEIAKSVNTPRSSILSQLGVSEFDDFDEGDLDRSRGILAGLLKAP